jgi:hypothetical protein
MSRGVEAAYQGAGKTVGSPTGPMSKAIATMANPIRTIETHTAKLRSSCFGTRKYEVVVDENRAMTYLQIDFFEQ